MSRITASTALAQLRDVLDRLAPHPGDRLPTERELSLQMGCSRQTLRLALARLEEEGEIWRMVGKGTFRGRPRLAIRSARRFCSRPPRPSSSCRQG
ncbi:winged helix-turn-helix domain-containing protein [Seohaeicola zhoushanensis]